VRRGRGAAALALAWLAAAPALAHEPVIAPLGFEPPAAGTYTLHRIMPAPDGEVLGLDGRPQPLARLTRERITVLGLIYTTCIDPDGCPRTLPVFDAVRARASASARLRDRVRLVTLSFDPERDTPAAMRGYAGARATAASPVPWRFLTTRSTRALAPLLDGFGQDVRVDTVRVGGVGRREVSHVLKVFLIDPDGFVREIYDSTFLHPRTVLNDVETLLLER
jgi:cytochrome oxidase Cu insertion factor (SCO1/SenC/PrrC family)